MLAAIHRTCEAQNADGEECIIEATQMSFRYVTSFSPGACSSTAATLLSISPFKSRIAHSSFPSHWWYGEIRLTASVTVPKICHGLLSSCLVPSGQRSSHSANQSVSSLVRVSVSHMRVWNVAFPHRRHFTSDECSLLSQSRQSLYVVG